jgi:hypothetical protein
MYKRFFFLLIVFFIIGIFACPGLRAIDQKVAVGIWLCDEGNGNKVGDTSGHGYDGKIVGDVKWSDGKSGKALEFIGKAGARVEIPHKDTLSLEKWTITAWGKLKPSPGGDWAVVVVKDPANGVQNYALDLDEVGMVCAEITSAGNWSGCSSNTAVYDDKWHFMAASYDGIALRVYVDGAKKGEQIFGKPDVNTAPVTIGGRMDNTQPLFGIVDDIGLFNDAIGENDLKTIMDKGLANALGLTSVEPFSKLTNTWGKVKTGL